MDDCTTDASKPGVQDEQGGIRKEGRKVGREDGLMQVGINAWLSAHLHICTSANVSTGGDDAWVAAQADAFLLLLLHTAHLESRMRKEGRKDWRIV